MSTTFKNSEEVIEMLKSINVTDPRVKIVDSSIVIIPFYWNRSLIASFIPICFFYIN